MKLNVFWQRFAGSLHSGMPLIYYNGCLYFVLLQVFLLTCFQKFGLVRRLLSCPLFHSKSTKAKKGRFEDQLVQNFPKPTSHSVLQSTLRDEAMPFNIILHSMIPCLTDSLCRHPMQFRNKHVTENPLTPSLCFRTIRIELSVKLDIFRYQLK